MGMSNDVKYRQEVTDNFIRLQLPHIRINTYLCRWSILAKVSASGVASVCVGKGETTYMFR